MHAPIDDQALDQLFRAARTRNGWSPEQVSEVLMRAVYDLAKMGPDFGQHLARAVRVRGVPSRQSASAAARLRRKQDKDGSGSGVCDHRPRPRLRAAAPQAVPARADRRLLVRRAGRPRRRSVPQRHAPGRLPDDGRAGARPRLRPDERVRQRRRGCGVLRGTNIKSNWLCNIGYGTDENLFPRHPRLDFEEACQVV
jgi:hypothetical protein